MAAAVVRIVHGKTLSDVLNIVGLVEAFKQGMAKAVPDEREYGGLVDVDVNNGTLHFKGPVKGESKHFGMEVYVRKELPQNMSLAAVWHVHPEPSFTGDCKPSDDDIKNAKTIWKDVFYLVVTGVKQPKKGFPDPDRFLDVTPAAVAGAFKVWYVKV